LYGFLVLRHSRWEILWLGVTAHPNAEWIARQLTDACGRSKPPQYIIRDRERLIDSIRRDCPDHVVIFGEKHLRHLLSCYQKQLYGPSALGVGEGCSAYQFWVSYTGYVQVDL